MLLPFIFHSRYICAVRCISNIRYTPAFAMYLDICFADSFISSAENKANH